MTLHAIYTPSHRVCQEELLDSLGGDLLVLGHGALSRHSGLRKRPESVLAGVGSVRACRGLLIWASVCVRVGAGYISGYYCIYIYIYIYNI